MITTLIFLSIGDDHFLSVRFQISFSFGKFVSRGIISSLLGRKYYVHSSECGIQYRMISSSIRDSARFRILSDKRASASTEASAFIQGIYKKLPSYQSPKYRINCLPVRALNDWNKLRENIVAAQTTSEFEIKLNKHRGGTQSEVDYNSKNAASLSV